MPCRFWQWVYLGQCINSLVTKLFEELNIKWAVILLYISKKPSNITHFTYKDNRGYNKN